jgi:hypothetical protein
MTFPTYSATLDVTPVMKKSMLDRVCAIGPIVVVHAAGDFANSLGAHLTTVLVAKPGETTDACLKRNAITPHKHDLVFNVHIEPTLD